VNGACLCGRVAVRVPGRPGYLNACNCALCWKLGALWGYYDPATVIVGGEVRSYRREDVAENHITADACPTCGTTINWSPLDPALGRMGVNMRLFDPASLRGLEVRYENGRDDEHPPVYREATSFENMVV